MPRLSYDLPFGLRAYGGGGYLFDVDPSNLGRGLAQAGGEWRSPWAFWQDRLRPVAGLDLQWKEENNWHTDLSLRAGIQFDSVSVLSRNLQILFEYYRGRSFDGQFFRDPVEYVGIGATIQLLIGRVPTLALLLAAFVVLSACADRPGASAPITLVFKHAHILGQGNPIPKLIAEFEARHPGVRVKAEALPWNSDEQRQFFVINLEGDSPGFDVMMLDVIWVPEFARAGWLSDLTGKVGPDELAAFFPSTVEAATQGRAHLGAAVEHECGSALLPSRSPRQVRHAPAGDVDGPRRPGGAHPRRRVSRRLDGILWQGKQYEGLMVNVLEGLWADGTDLLGADGTVFPDPARAEAVLAFMRDLISRGVSPPWTTAADEELTRRAFGRGEAVFLRNWPYAYDLLQQADSPVRGRVGIAALPRHRDGTRGAGSTGGSHLAIHRKTRHPDLALDLARTLTSEAAQRLMVTGAALYPTRMALYHAPDLVRIESGAARDRGPHACGTAAARDAVLPHDLDAAPARAVGGVGRREDPGARRGRRAAGSRLRPARRRRGRGGRAAVTPRERAARHLGLLYLSPALIALGALTVYPGLWVLWLSLQQRMPIFGIERFDGLGNYLFLATDPRFWTAARVTLVFAAASVSLEIILGLGVALLLWTQQLGRRLALGLLLLAWALPAVVTAKMFEWLYHPAAGLVNFLLGGREINWLGDPTLALVGLILADVWRTMPFVALLCYARLTGIPGELYESAQVDGAGRAAMFGLITLPMLAAHPPRSRRSSARWTRSAPST